MEISKDTVKRLGEFAAAMSMYGPKEVQTNARWLASAIDKELKDAGEGV